MKLQRTSWDDYFIGIAEAVSRRATCPRRSVGAVIVRDYDKRIVATGYNGAPAGKPHCIDEGCYVVGNHCRRTIHAERNAIDYSTIGRVKGITYTIYTTLEPCDECYMEIAKYPINTIVWAISQEDYKRGKE